MVSKMGEFLSGAIAFEFSMENNEYGLVITPGFLSGQDSLQMFQPFHHKTEHLHFFYFQKSFDHSVIYIYCKVEVNCSQDPKSEGMT